MGRPLRQQRPEAIYFVSNRCSEARFFFRPGPEVNKIILGVLAYVASKYEVEIFGFVFMSNHFHMIIRARKLELHDFMRDFQGQVAKRLNKHWGRGLQGEGTFFAGRYTSPEILDNEMLVEKLCYTLCNPCLSNLVRHPNLWPGLNTLKAHQAGVPLVGEYLNSTKYWKFRRKHPEMDDDEVRRRATEEYVLTLAKLPMWADLDGEAYDRKVCEIVEEYALELADERTVPCLGAKKVCAQHFNHSPAEPKRSPRPVCLSSDPELRDEFREQFYEMTGSYRKAVGKLRKGKADVEFPFGTIPPGHVCCVGARPRDALPEAA